MEGCSYGYTGKLSTAVIEAFATVKDTPVEELKPVNDYIGSGCSRQAAGKRRRRSSATSTLNC